MKSAELPRGSKAFQRLHAYWNNGCTQNPLKIDARKQWLSANGIDFPRGTGNQCKNVRVQSVGVPYVSNGSCAWASWTK